jgi:hypothetical protein
MLSDIEAIVPRIAKIEIITISSTRVKAEFGFRISLVNGEIVVLKIPSICFANTPSILE